MSGSSGYEMQLAEMRDRLDSANKTVRILENQLAAKTEELELVEARVRVGDVVGTRFRIDSIEGKVVIGTCLECGKSGVRRTVCSVHQGVREGRASACKKCLSKAKRNGWGLPGRKLFEGASP